MKIRKEEALEYHSRGRKGKVEVVPTKPCLTQHDLSLAYTPGVAEPCREIHKNDDLVYEYTAKGNLVAVVSNGTAVLGLGDIGPHAGKPVMEGKGVLFKRFADVDVFDIELKTHDPDEVIKVCQLLEPTFGGINLEDIKAPECFYIEETLKKTMNIPVFHDDQHGTAIISGAALLNAVEIVGKKMDEIKMLINGAGAAANACAKLYIKLGVKKENIFMCDSKGMLSTDRVDLNESKKFFAQKTSIKTLFDAFEGMDVFVGLSAGNCVTKDMLKKMNPDPIVFAMANPDPEISYEDALEARSDVIMATGRSDYPNQVNNVLGFPFIFRGALDVRATSINDTMKLAASHALADLAKQDVPDSVRRAYAGEEIKFGREYIIPKPFDPRVLMNVAPAVAKAAIETGVARVIIKDWDKYRAELEARLGISKPIMNAMMAKAKADPRKIVFPEGERTKILRACQRIVDLDIAKPVLLGRKEIIVRKAEEHKIELEGVEIIDIASYPKIDQYAEEYFKLRQRKGITKSEAETLIRKPNYFGAMMVKMCDAHGMISGLTSHYPDTIRPALEIIGMNKKYHRVAGMYIMVTKKGTFFFADTTVNINPTVEELADIAIMTATSAKRFNIEPKIALLSFSNFGSAPDAYSAKVKKAVELIKVLAPDLIVDGEMQADTAVVPEIIDEHYPFSTLKGGANVLIFPDLNSGNIAYKLMNRIGGADTIGPVLLGMKKPVHVLQTGAEVSDIVNMTAITVVEAIDKWNRTDEE
jgi:malate dehydrogenase (oxaloacetate-decarboxylating)(NADP+)